MKEEELVTDEEFGSVSYAFSPRAKRMNIRVRSKGVRVAMPLGYERRDGEQFMNRHREWIRRAIEKLKGWQKPTSRDAAGDVLAKPIKADAVYKCQSFSIVLRCSSLGKPTIAEEAPGHVVVGIPGSILQKAGQEPEQDTLRPFFGEGLKWAMDKYTREMLIPRLAELSELSGLGYSQAKISHSHTAWGYCTAGNRISLSVYLLFLPEKLRDHVMLHELCHTAEHNHSARFHALLDHHLKQLLGRGEAECIAELKAWQTRPYMHIEGGSQKDAG